jgi:hypothetical protein
MQHNVYKKKVYSLSNVNQAYTAVFYWIHLTSYNCFEQVSDHAVKQKTFYLWDMYEQLNEIPCTVQAALK